MRYQRSDDGHDRIATFDIETTHYEPERGEIVSIGIGVHDRGTPGAEATYEHFHRTGDDEADVIARAFRTLDESAADALISYNGAAFDMSFIEGRLDVLDTAVAPPELAAPTTHIDLFEGRKEKADRTGEKWPSLEESLESYGFEPAVTTLNGDTVDNGYFGDDLGPAYLAAVDAGTDERIDELADVIDHYLVTDLEANIALYYADIEAPFETEYLGADAAF